MTNINSNTLQCSAWDCKWWFGGKRTGNLQGLFILRFRRLPYRDTDEITPKKRKGWSLYHLLCRLCFSTVKVKMNSLCRVVCDVQKMPVRCSILSFYYYSLGCLVKVVWYDQIIKDRFSVGWNIFTHGQLVSELHFLIWYCELWRGIEDKHC
jgi:hypothetical protein